MSKRLEAWFDLVPRQGLVQIDDERQATEYAIRLVECAEDEVIISKAELRALVTEIGRKFIAMATPGEPFGAADLSRFMRAVDDVLGKAAP